MKPRKDGRGIFPNDHPVSRLFDRLDVRGCIQIHTGEVKNLVTTGPWYNVLDPEFNMHLREDAIVSSFIVKKPSVDGIVTSLEIFDAKGEMIVQFFGKRKPGIPELESWREIVNNVTGF